LGEDCAPRITVRGRATRTRILDAACDLMYAGGVNATTLDDVREASGTSKSQLYRHFPSKDELVLGVIAEHSGRILSKETAVLAGVSSLAGLDRWAAALVRTKEIINGSYGCVIGSMANELADQNEAARTALDDALEQWRVLIRDALARIAAHEPFRDGTDLDRLAVGVLAALQGGYLLARVAHDVTSLRVALDMALDHVHSQLE
jgi:TetR/AcrR family transcriptional regulator, transcriptional repressor for nem operon